MMAMIMSDFNRKTMHSYDVSGGKGRTGENETEEKRTPYYLKRISQYEMQHTTILHIYDHP